MFCVCKTSVTSVLYINKIIINIMIIEVMYTANWPHSFVDSRPHDDIDRIRSLDDYTESVTHDEQPIMST